MKAYPLIYSRTKNEDFVPDFLTRPVDLDWRTALKFVGDAMRSLDGLDTIRYSTFVVGNYCICGGISCVTKILLNEVKNEMPEISGFTTDIDEYIKDCKGRNMIAFIGFAIKKDDICSGKIPDLKYSKYWEVYLEYLKKQWFASKTESEKIEIPPLELDEKSYNSLYTPEFLQIGEKFVITSFNDDPQSTVEYFFDRIINKSENVSFISNIKRREDWDKTIFQYTHVSDDLLTIIKSKPLTSSQEKPIIQESESIDYNSSNTKKTGFNFGEYKRTSVSSEMNNRYSNQSQNFKEPEKKKNTTTPTPLLPALVLAIAVILLVIIVILLVQKNAF